MDFPNKKKVIFGGCAINRKCRLYQLDPESISIISVHYFLIEKNTKYFSRASGLECIRELESVAKKCGDRVRRQNLLHT